MQTSDLVLMGYLTQPFGVKGFIKVKSETQYIDSLLDYEYLYIGKDINTLKPYTVEESLISGDVLCLKLSNINDRDQAIEMRSSLIYVSRQDFPDDLESDEYYWQDLIDCQVYNHKNEFLGKVVNLMATGANDVLRVEGDNKYLIPFVNHYVTEVDTDNKKIIVEWELDF